MNNGMKTTDRITASCLSIRLCLGIDSTGFSSRMGSGETGTGRSCFSSIISSWFKSLGVPVCVRPGSSFSFPDSRSSRNGKTAGFASDSDGLDREICGGCDWAAGVSGEMGFSISPSACLAWRLFGLIANTRLKQYSRFDLSEKQIPKPSQPCSEDGSSLTSRAKSTAAFSRSPVLAAVNAAWSKESFAITLKPNQTIAG